MSSIIITGFDQLLFDTKAAAIQATNEILLEEHSWLRENSPWGLTQSLQKSWKVELAKIQSGQVVGSVYTDIPYADYQDSEVLRHAVPENEMGKDSFQRYDPGGDEYTNEAKYWRGYQEAISTNQYYRYQADFTGKAAEEAKADSEDDFIMRIIDILTHFGW